MVINGSGSKGEPVRRHLQFERGKSKNEYTLRLAVVITVVVFLKWKRLFSILPPEKEPFNLLSIPPTYSTWNLYMMTNEIQYAAIEIE